MIPCNFKTCGANVALEKKVVAQKDAFLAQTDLSRIHKAVGFLEIKKKCHKAVRYIIYFQAWVLRIVEGYAVICYYSHLCPLIYIDLL